MGGVQQGQRDKRSHVKGGEGSEEGEQQGLEKATKQNKR